MRSRPRIAGAALALVSVTGFAGVAGVAHASTTGAKSQVPLGLGGIPKLTKAEITKWKDLISAAQQEGKLVVVSSHSTQEGQYWNQFQQEFGIQVQLITGSPTQISTRILAERQQGVHAEDVVMAGGATMGRISAAGGFQPIAPDYVIPQLIDRSSANWYFPRMPQCDFDTAGPGKTGGAQCTLITFTPAQNVVKFYYNTQLVSKKELAKIKSWNDLLQPKWAGKWVIQNVAQDIDPSDRQLGWALLGEKYWSKFMKVLKPTVLDSGGDVTAVNGVLRGQWDFAGFIGDTSPYILAQQQGLPIAFFTKILAPGALPDLGQRVSLMAQAPDQAAAELYLNWAMSPQGQAAWNEGCAQQGDAALYKKAPKGQLPGFIWQPAIHTKKIYVAADHTADINNSLAWWQQEMAKLGVH